MVRGPVAYAPVVYALAVLSFLPAGLLLSYYMSENLKKQFVDGYSSKVRKTGSLALAAVLLRVSLRDLWIWLQKPVELPDALHSWRARHAHPAENSKPASLPSVTAP